MLFIRHNLPPVAHWDPRPATYQWMTAKDRRRAKIRWRPSSRTISRAFCSRHCNNNTAECGLILILIIEESKYAIHAPYRVLYLNLFYFYHIIRKLQLNDAFEPPATHTHSPGSLLKHAQIREESLEAPKLSYVRLKVWSQTVEYKVNPSNQWNINQNYYCRI